MNVYCNFGTKNSFTSFQRKRFSKVAIARDCRIFKINSYFRENNSTLSVAAPDLKKHYTRAVVESSFSRGSYIEFVFAVSYYFLKSLHKISSK